MDKILAFSIAAEPINVLISSPDSKGSVMVLVDVPNHLDGWAYSLDGKLYKNFPEDNETTITFTTSGVKTIYFRGLNIIDDEEILDSNIIEKTVTIPIVAGLVTESSEAILTQASEILNFN